MAKSKAMKVHVQSHVCAHNGMYVCMISIHAAKYCLLTWSE